MKVRDGRIGKVWGVSWEGMMILWRRLREVRVRMVEEKVVVV